MLQAQALWFTCVTHLLQIITCIEDLLELLQRLESDATGLSSAARLLPQIWTPQFR